MKKPKPKKLPAGVPELTPFLLLVKPIKPQDVPAEKRQADTIKACEEQLAEMAQKLREPDPGMNALMQILSMVNDGIIHLRKVAYWCPEFLRPTARGCAVWPEFVGKNPGLRKHHKWLVKQLELGEDDIARAPFRADSPATKQAGLMLRWLRENQRALALPDLTQETKGQWFQAGWKHLLIASKGRPDKNVVLAAIGKSAIGKKSTSRGMAVQTDGMKRDDVNAKIRAIIWSSFRTLTRHSPNKTS